MVYGTEPESEDEPESPAGEPEDEAAFQDRLHAVVYGGERQADEFQLLRCGEQHRFVLQAVTRADFYNFYS